MKISHNFRSANYSIRNNNIEFIILHYTEMNFNASVTKLCDPDSKVSSHYLIDQKGNIFSLVANGYCAWHSGVSKWHNLEAINNYSIGIEIENLGNHLYPQKQLDSCISLCQYLINHYNIPHHNILAHSDVAPNRKIDPGPLFDWQYLANHGLGKWYNCVLPTEEFTICSYGDHGYEIEHMQLMLAKVGYDIKVNSIFDWQTNCVLRAFQMHFYSEKLIKQGIKFYNDLNSLYDYDNISKTILMDLSTQR